MRQQLLAGWAGPGLRHAGGPALLAVAGLVWGTGFWWLTMRILLTGRISGRALFSAACTIGVLYVAMQTVFSLVFSAMVVSDEHTYGPIGTIFALLSYLIAIGVVVILGTVAGRTWRERSSGPRETGQLAHTLRFPDSVHTSQVWRAELRPGPRSSETLDLRLDEALNGLQAAGPELSSFFELSAWESVRLRRFTWPGLRVRVSASDHERPLVAGDNCMLIARRSWE